jgi:hypothetical protein
MDLDKLKNNPEQVKLLISLLASLLPDEDNMEQPKSKKTKKSDHIEPQHNLKVVRGKAKSSGVNYFDSMKEKHAHKEDIEIDKKLCKYPPTERRPKAVPVTIQCRSCGKKEKVSSSLVFDQERYKCNKCSSSSG